MRSTPAIHLHGDPQKIEHVIRIFVDNAIKYTPKGGSVSIKVINNYIGQYNPGNQDGLIIQITDTGRGIRKEDMKKIFQRFFRAEDVKSIAGTGLGLAIAQEMVQIHQGDIFAESEFGMGTTINVFLPRIQQAPD